MKAKKSLLFAFLVAGCSSAAPEPVLYPNSHLRAVSETKAELDVQECRALADAYTEQPNRYQELAKAGVVGGAVGAGTGALAGTIMDQSVGRATGAGAAVGSIVGLASELRKQGQGDPTEREFTRYCLEKRGYEVAGWR